MYSLPSLPYGADALRPVIGEETMRTHHGKHHAGYVRVVNELLGDRAGSQPLEDVISAARGRGDRKLFNNAAQAWNHAFFWESMTPAAPAPTAHLQAAIDAGFGGLSALEDSFVAEGAGHFGSGWVWLMATQGKLAVVSSHDADQPWLASGGTPLLVCDVWEHAYYLDYKNERKRFLRAWFEGLANWDFAAEQLAAAGRGDTGFRYPLTAATAGTGHAPRPSLDPR
jgi:Fe-Mn family superoxide dismutase